MSNKKAILPMTATMNQLVTAPKTLGCEGCVFYETTVVPSVDPDGEDQALGHCLDPDLPNGKTLGEMLTGRACDDSHIFKIARLVEVV